MSAKSNIQHEQAGHIWGVQQTYRTSHYLVIYNTVGSCPARCLVFGLKMQKQEYHIADHRKPLLVLTSRGSDLVVFSWFLV